jgi:hypothetical protein
VFKSGLYHLLSRDLRIHKNLLKSNILSWVWWLTLVILATQEVEIGRISVQGQLGQKLCETPSQSRSWTWWYISVIPTTQKTSTGGAQFRPARDIKARPYLKNSGSKKG